MRSLASLVSVCTIVMAYANSTFGQTATATINGTPVTITLAQPRAVQKLTAPVFFGTGFVLMDTAKFAPGSFFTSDVSTAGATLGNVQMPTGTSLKGAVNTWLTLPAGIAVPPQTTAAIGSEFPGNVVVPPPLITLGGVTTDTIKPELMYKEIVDGRVERQQVILSTTHGFNELNQSLVNLVGEVRGIRQEVTTQGKAIDSLQKKNEEVIVSLKCIDKRVTTLETTKGQPVMQQQQTVIIENTQMIEGQRCYPNRNLGWWVCVDNPTYGFPFTKYPCR